MRATVRKVISDLTIEIDPPWTFQKMTGNRVRIAGLAPAERDRIQQCKEDLQRLIGGKLVSITDFLFVSGSSLYAVVYYDQKPIQQSFLDRMIPSLDPSRWIEPEEKKLASKVFGGIPVSWSNPLASMPPEQAPFLDNTRYPSKIWAKSYEEERKLVEVLYSDSHYNKLELDKAFHRFLSTLQKEAPLVVVGEVGTGKSWWLCRTLMNLDPKKYHVIVVDLRYTLRMEDLQKSIALEIDDFLLHLLPDLSWLYPDFEAIYKGRDFNPEDPIIKKQLEEAALDIKDVYERVKKKLRYYDRPEVPELIVAFDNIDHFNEEELSIVADTCRRIVGYSSGVRSIITMRPTTRLPKSRAGLFFGDAGPANARVIFKSPDVYHMLQRRLSISDTGTKLNLRRRIGDTYISWEELCCSETLPQDAKGRFSEAKSTAAGVSYDLRHYLKLFRRILHSDVLGSLMNIGNIYYGIHALLLAGKDPMSDADSYLFNLFDNEKPTRRGNALVRYRVLEYCKLFNDLGEVFDFYFRALGCEVESARHLLDLFRDAGLTHISYKEDEMGNKMPSEAILTVAGQRHFDIVTNLWYIICIKTGMNIFADLVLRGEDAKSKASEFVKSDKILDYYAEHGWVSEEDFIEFLGLQEVLEYKRIGDFQASHPEWKDVVANMVAKISSPAANIYWSYNLQKKYWLRSHAIPI